MLPKTKTQCEIPMTLIIVMTLEKVGKIFDFDGQLWIFMDGCIKLYFVLFKFIFYILFLLVFGNLFFNNAKDIIW